LRCRTIPLRSRLRKGARTSGAPEEPLCAGRALGRREATGVIDRKTGEVKRAGKVTPEMMRAWISRAGIELRGTGLDESPDCYKLLDEVLESVGDTVRILHRLTPVGVAMAGANEFDPH